METEVMNNLGACPSVCDDAAITVDLAKEHEKDGAIRLVVIIDCDHSGVCAKRQGERQ